MAPRDGVTGSVKQGFTLGPYILPRLLYLNLIPPPSPVQTAPPISVHTPAIHPDAQSQSLGPIFLSHPTSNAPAIPTWSAFKFTTSCIPPVPPSTPWTSAVSTCLLGSTWPLYSLFSTSSPRARSFSWLLQTQFSPRPMRPCTTWCLPSPHPISCCSEILAGFPPAILTSLQLLEPSKPQGLCNVLLPQPGTFFPIPIARSFLYLGLSLEATSSKKPPWLPSLKEVHSRPSITPCVPPSAIISRAPSSAHCAIHFRSPSLGSPPPGPESRRVGPF